MTRTPATLRAHAHDLATAFNVRLIEDARLKPEEAFAAPQLRVVVATLIIDETTYAVALHELGHLCAAFGFVRPHTTGDRASLLRVEEDAAWTWARHYALDWTPVMDAVARWAESTYQSTPRPVDPPPAPVAPTSTPSINWQDWK